MKLIDNFKLKNIDELVEWFDENCNFEYAPWHKWFDNNYCHKCPSEIGKCTYTGREMEFCWCEVNDNKCKFFPNMDSTLDSKQVIKMWLESEIEE